MSHVLLLMLRNSISKAMGIAADCWLMYMDRLLTLGDEMTDEKAVLRQKIDELIDIYYDALDAPKKGRKVSSDFCIIVCISFSCLIMVCFIISCISF